MTERKIERAVQKVFSFKPADIVKQMNLLRPIYSKSNNYGHFGRRGQSNDVPWEKTDKAAALAKLCK